jgi:hypothetical protein
MILNTHAVVGAAIASFVPTHLAIAFVLGFSSHFVLDASVNPKIRAPMSVLVARSRGMPERGALCNASSLPK